MVIFPGIGKHASKQHKHDGNRDQVRRGVYEGEIRGLVYTNHFGSQRADRTVSESLEAPLVSVHASAKQHVEILEKGRWQQPKMNDHRINRKRRHAASTTLMEFRSPAEESIRLATPLIRILGRILGTFFSGGVAGAVDIESAHFSWISFG